MSFLSPTFMFIFLPVALSALFITVKPRRTDFLPVIGIVFFVCVNISDPLALLYISFVSIAVIAAMAIYQKTHNSVCLKLCAAFFFILGSAILILRMFGSFSMLRGAGVVMCLMSSVSLCLDVAKGNTKAPQSLWDGVAYVTYFPTMLTGPFVTYEEFTARTNELSINVKCFSKGAMLFLKGFVKAVFIGAILGDAFTGVLAFGSNNMGIAAAVLVAAAQSIALYAFFSGYSDIARGVSLMAGIEIESDMGDPFLNLTPSEYLRKFFKGFSVFFKRYIAAPIISLLGENLFSRALASLFSAAMLLLLFCQNYESLLLLLPFTGAAEYFVLFGRSSKKRPSLPRRIAEYLITFIIMGAAWAVVSSGSLDEMLKSIHHILSNDALYLSYSAADRLLNSKYIILPTVGCIISSAASFIESRDEKMGERVGFTVFKYVVAFILLLAFAVGVIMLLPQFPALASHAFGANFI